MSLMAEIEINSDKTRDEILVRHEGIVTKVSNDSITVSLKGNLHCDACNARSACGISDSGSKEIEINTPAQSLELNENVEVFLKKNLGLKAVFWAYVFPFILLFATLLIASSVYQEWIAGLLAVGVLIPYYLLLYALKNSFKNEFKVSVSKIS
jgi:sigma-E factor negative regulatory protein RseC